MYAMTIDHIPKKLPAVNCGQGDVVKGLEGRILCPSRKPQAAEPFSIGYNSHIQQNNASARFLPMPVVDQHSLDEACDRIHNHDHSIPDEAGVLRNSSVQDPSTQFDWRSTNLCPFFLN